MGIDLGTTYSCVGVWLSNRVEIIPNEMGNKKTPSYVAFSDTHLVGEEAKSRASFNLTNTIFNIKRLIGRRSNDNLPIVHIKKFWPFKVEFNPKNHRYMVRVNYKGKEKLFSPEEISSMVLRKMREIAEAHLGTTVKNAVISVPAHFNTSQRQATFDAGVIAGLNVMRLINEPSAAALAYGFDRNVGWMGMKNILVFDLGGGTLDVSLLNIHQGTFKVVSTAGDTYLGGEDFEDAMVNHFIDEFKKKHKQDISSSYKAIRRLKAACEKAKNVLTMTEQATIDIDCLYEEFDFFSTISRTEFEKLNSHLMIKCKEVVKRCLGDVTSDSIDEVLLVGGSSRIRMVQEMLRGFFFGKKLCKAVNADEAVAYGATLQAAMLTCHNGNEEVPKLVLHDVVPLDLSTSINGTYKKTLYQKNTIQPMGDKKLLHLQQYWIHSLDVYEGDQLLRSLILDCDHQLRFVIDENGIWHAWKLVANTEQENEVAIVEGQLSKEEKWKMVEEAKAYNFQDKVHKKNVESKNSLEKFVYDVKKAINDKKMEGKLDAANKEKIEAAVEKVIKWLASVPLIEEKEYKEKMLELQSICHAILSNSQSWR